MAAKGAGKQEDALKRAARLEAVESGRGFEGQVDEPFSPDEEQDNEAWGDWQGNQAPEEDDLEKWSDAEAEGEEPPAKRQRLDSRTTTLPRPQLASATPAPAAPLKGVGPKGTWPKGAGKKGVGKKGAGQEGIGPKGTGLKGTGKKDAVYHPWGAESKGGEKGKPATKGGKGKTVAKGGKGKLMTKAPAPEPEPEEPAEPIELEKGMIVKYDGGERAWIDSVLEGVDEYWICNEDTCEVVSDKAPDGSDLGVRHFSAMELEPTGEWTHEVKYEKTITVKVPSEIIENVITDISATIFKVPFDIQQSVFGDSSIVFGPGFPPDLDDAVGMLNEHMEELMRNLPPKQDSGETTGGDTEAEAEAAAAAEAEAAAAAAAASQAEEEAFVAEFLQAAVWDDEAETAEPKTLASSGATPAPKAAPKSAPTEAAVPNDEPHAMLRSAGAKAAPKQDGFLADAGPKAPPKAAGPKSAPKAAHPSQTANLGTASAKAAPISPPKADALAAKAAEEAAKEAEAAKAAEEAAKESEAAKAAEAAAKAAEEAAKASSAAGATTTATQQEVANGKAADGGSDKGSGAQPEAPVKKTVQEWIDDQSMFSHLPPLPEGWIRVMSSSKSNSIYYVNFKTGARTFKTPEEELPPNWKRVTSRSSGKPYFFHTVTGKCQFDRPTK